MDFFERQDKARHNTRLLVIYFAVGVALLTICIYFAVLFTFRFAQTRQHRYAEAAKTLSLWHPQIFYATALGTLAVVIGGALFRTAQLSQGGSAVAEMLDGRLVSSNTNDPDERKLLNIVEEMSIASGVPVPQVYVMDEEHGINAFAAGHTTSDAAVCVTRGCMKILNRDELQGVIGHEYSHILNGDMRLNLRLMGVIFGILCLAIIGRVLLHARGRSSRDKNPLPIIGLVLIMLGWVGVFFGRLIQSAVSRQREFLADASAVQFTRNPDGLSGALKKIGGLGAMGSRVSAAHATEVSHMFFGNGGAQPLFGLLATHPPLQERIRAIDPNFDGTFPEVRYDAAVEDDEDVLAGIPALESARAHHRATSIAAIAPPVIPANAVLPTLGAPTPTHLRYAVDLRNSFPDSLKTAARDPLGASALIYALLISSNPEIRTQQLELLGNASSPARQETERLLADVAVVATRSKLPLVDLALPALRNFSPAQYQQFNQLIQQLIECDGEIDLFEYVLQKIVLRHLDPQFNGARKPVIQFYAIRALAPDCAVLLSALAHVGAKDPSAAQSAFGRGAQLLAYQAQSELGFIASEQCDLSQIDGALNRISQSAPQIKKNALNACAQVVAADGLIQEMEAELLRAIADTLDCPIPPIVKAEG